MITRYAYIKNNKTVWGPGPNPYFITMEDGSQWEILAHTTQENETQGIYIVEQINYREVDDRFEQALTPAYSIVGGRPRETWTYVFVPPARDNMLLGVDEHAENLRKEFATQWAGQYQEYDEAYNEAVEVKALPSSTTIVTGTYPFLDADINVTFSPTLNRTVQNVREAADLVIATRDFWKSSGAEIRKNRLIVKKQIRDALTDSAAFVIYNNYINS